MNRLKIAFDLDGVLIDLLPVIQKHLLDLYGAKGEIARQSGFRIGTIGEHSNSQVWKAINLAYSDIESTKPIPGATELLEALQAKSRDTITVVTARPNRAMQDTIATIKELFPGILFRLYMSGSEPKTKYLKGFEYFVDDRRKTILEVAEAGIIGILLDKPYNQMDVWNIKNVLRITDLNHLHAHVDRFMERTAV